MVYFLVNFYCEVAKDKSCYSRSQMIPESCEVDLCSC